MLVKCQEFAIEFNHLIAHNILQSYVFLTHFQKFQIISAAKIWEDHARLSVHATDRHIAFTCKLFYLRFTTRTMAYTVALSRYSLFVLCNSDRNIQARAVPGMWKIICQGERRGG